MPACHLPWVWYVYDAGVHPSSTNMSTFFILLPRWLAIDQHASMPSTGGADMLGVHPSSTGRPAFLPFPSLAGHRPACQHANMPACHSRGAGMLGCTQAAQTDQHSCPLPHACQHQHAVYSGVHPRMLVLWLSSPLSMVGFSILGLFGAGYYENEGLYKCTILSAKSTDV